MAGDSRTQGAGQVEGEEGGINLNPLGDGSITACPGSHGTALLTWRNGKDTDLNAEQLEALAQACVEAAIFLHNERARADGG